MNHKQHLSFKSAQKIHCIKNHQIFIGFLRMEKIRDCTKFLSIVEKTDTLNYQKNLY